MKSITYKLKSINGLSSRASIQLVNIANKFKSELILSFKNETANLKSVMSVMALIIRNNETFSINATGIDENEAIDAINIYLNDSKLI